MTLWAMKLKTEAARHDRMIGALNAQAAVYKEAREYDNKDFQFTRRVIALAAVGAIVVWPKLAAVFWPEIGVTIGYTEWNPGFWFFTDGVDQMKWVTAKGLTLTALDTHLMSGIVGMYFGASVVRNA
jgi:hypothetical protein